jgi:hypothetical protein
VVDHGLEPGLFKPMTILVVDHGLEPGLFKPMTILVVDHGLEPGLFNPMTILDWCLLLLCYAQSIKKYEQAPIDS